MTATRRRTSPRTRCTPGQLRPRQADAEPGIRWDRQDDAALPAICRPTRCSDAVCRRSTSRAPMPCGWNKFATTRPHLRPHRHGRTVLQASYSLYYGQIAPGQLRPISPHRRGDRALPLGGPQRRQVRPGERSRHTRRSRPEANYNPNNPTNGRPARSVDPYVKNPRTGEIIVGFDRRSVTNLAVGVSYVWRNYDRFFWQDVNGFTSADWRSVSFTPAATSCPAGARCETVTYYEPVFAIPSPFTYHECAGSLARLQRFRASVPEALFEPVARRHQLRVQQRHRRV